MTWARYVWYLGQSTKGMLGKVCPITWAKYQRDVGQGTKVENEDFESCSLIKIKFLLGTYKVYVGTC